mmetsp:Transcript_16937/g.38727  ORF Transcript_16937/g.38727 Transcript_16937/m.38727 type:complete len:214 (-) Transcript_16937:983-1624(-)
MTIPKHTLPTQWCYVIPFHASHVRRARIGGAGGSNGGVPCVYVAYKSKMNVSIPLTFATSLYRSGARPQVHLTLARTWSQLRAAQEEEATVPPQAVLSTASVGAALQQLPGWLQNGSGRSLRIGRSVPQTCARAQVQVWPWLWAEPTIALSASDSSVRANTTASTRRSHSLWRRRCVERRAAPRIQRHQLPRPRSARSQVAIGRQVHADARWL